MRGSAWMWIVVIVAAVSAAGLSAVSAVRAEGETELVSVASSGTQGNGDSKDPSISGDGRYVAFESTSTTLGSSSPASDVFVRDRQTGTTTLVSVDSDGVETSGASFSAAISDNGRYVAFVSTSKFSDKDTGTSTMNVYVRDFQNGTTSIVSVDSNEEALSPTYNIQPPPAPSISADGRYVAFESPANLLVGNDDNGSWDIFVRDRSKGKTSRVSVTSSGEDKLGDSQSPSISGDGRYVAFASRAILSGDDNNGAKDIFLRDLQSGTTTLVSVSSSGAQGNGDSSQPAISADGRYVAFTSLASNLVANDNNSTYDVFVRDLQTGETTMASVDTAGQQVASTNYSPAISGDGRYVVFVSPASSLVEGDNNGAWDIFIRDREKGVTTRASVASDGTQGNGDSVERPCISADGKYVAFESLANNLVSGDSNGAWDVFVHENLPQADIELDGSPFSVGDRLMATFKLNEDITQPFTAFAVVILPSGAMLNALTLDSPLKPIATNVPRLSAPFSYPLLDLAIPAGAPKGDYEIVVAFFTPGAPITGRDDAFLESSVEFTVE